MEKKMATSVFAGETEQKVEPAVYIGNLSNLGLGREQDGITSNLSTENYGQYADLVTSYIVDIEDKNHIACIDGRFTSCQINGDKEVSRARIAGGILSYDVAALLSRSSLADSLSSDDRVLEKFSEVEKFANSTISIAPSSHSGGCGAANGLVDHLKAIKSDKIASASAAIFDLVNADINTSYNSYEYDEIANASTELAHILEAEGWEGNNFVEAVSHKEPGGVEQLEADPMDQYNGHREQAIIIVRGNKTISKNKLIELGLGQAFVVNVDLLNDIAVSLSGLQGKAGYSKALHSLVSFQLAVASNLCNKNMPIFLV